MILTKFKFKILFWQDSILGSRYLSGVIKIKTDRIILPAYWEKRRNCFLYLMTIFLAY